MTGSKEDDIDESEEANSNNGKKIFLHIFEFVYCFGRQFGMLEHCLVKSVCTSKDNIRDKFRIISQVMKIIMGNLRRILRRKRMVRRRQVKGRRLRTPWTVRTNRRTPRTCSSQVNVTKYR